MRKRIGLKRRPRVVVIGLDCFDPHLLFDRWRDELPNLKALMNDGCWGKLRSVIPPITAPAWACMLSGVDPGVLGIYGFRHLRSGTYDDLYIATSDTIKIHRVWDSLSINGYRVGLINVPQTFPPKVVNGFMVSSFLTPGTDVDYTYPPEIKEEINEIIDEYIFDVTEFRGADKERILERIYEMTQRRTKVALEFMRKKRWDFFMVVYMGPDRIQHAFWRYMDEEHPDYVPGNKFENTIFDYYKFIDNEIGKLIAATKRKIRGRRAIFFVVSDHGAKRNKGSISINEWLIREGYLTIKEKPKQKGSPLMTDNIIWEKTKARAVGGYYARIYLNLWGREAQGIIEPKDYTKALNELKEKIKAIPDVNGLPINTKVFQPADLFQELNGDYPDLMVFFDDLAIRAAGTIGYPSIYMENTDVGFDDANHNWDGIFIISNYQGQKGELQGVNIIDICPTILRIFDIKIPNYIQGEAIGLDYKSTQE